MFRIKQGDVITTLFTPCAPQRSNSTAWVIKDGGFESLKVRVERLTAS